MSVNIDSINNVITGYDNSSRNAYNLFSFVDDSQNEYNNAGIFEKEISDMFTNFRPYVLSEDSKECSITNIDRLNYDSKLNKLITILNTCKDPNIANKNECIYNEFIKNDTIDTINDLTEIILKLNNECTFKKISAEEKNNICNANSRDILNNYSSDKINKNYDFINKYSTIILNLKTIADNNLKDYLTQCKQDPERIAKYNTVQNSLAKALFETKICPSSTPESCPECPSCPPVTKSVCLQNSDILSDINNLKLDKENLTTQYNNALRQKNMILQEYDELQTNADSLVWDSTLSFRNGWLLFGILLIFIIIIVFLGYYSFGRVSKYDYDRSSYGRIQNVRPFAN
jgi:hypothetical protein